MRGVPEQSWLNASGDEVLTTARAGPRGAPRAGRRHRGRAAQRSRSGAARPRALRPRRHRRPRAALAADRRQGLRAGAAQPLGQAHRRPAQADARDGQRRRRPAGPPHRRAARRRPDRHRSPPALPPRVAPPRCSCAGSSTPSRPAPRATSRLEVEDDLPEVFADPDKFTQVVTNLVENAVRHGQGQVSVRLAGVAEPARACGITVDDEGDGIPVELRRRVFTKFWTTGDVRRQRARHVHRRRAVARPRRLGHDRRRARRRRPGDGRLAERGPAPGVSGRDLHTTFTSRPRRPPVRAPRVVA